VSYPFIIWTEPRTAGTAFSAALKSVSEYESVEDEPFQYGADPKQLASVYENWCLDGSPKELYKVLAKNVLIKHIPEAFDDNFNADLARAAENNNYCHIRLIRCDTFARLISRGIAEQLDMWNLKANLRLDSLKPLDVPHLVADLKLDASRWNSVSAYLTRVLVVRTEDIVSRNRARRHKYLKRVLKFLELPRDKLANLDLALSNSNQDTARVYSMIPNIDQLRSALSYEGVR
jgi:hypothetical protein